MKYDYIKNIQEDIKEYLKENNITEITEDLYDTLIVEDSITGNASGSYTFNTWTAEEFLAHNTDLLIEACEEFCQDVGDAIKKGAENCDVIIRCYLLPQALDNLRKEVDYIE